jgi:hypothetical protein
MKLHAALVVSFGLLALAGCTPGRGERVIELPGGVQEEDPDAPTGFFGQSSRRNAGPCPLMGAVYDNARLVDFAAPNNERYANIEFTGEVQGVRGLCRYLDADPIQMSVEVDMAFGRGPASTADRQTYRYWVAVVRRGFAPIEKAYFDVDVRWSRGESIVTRTEAIENIVIPRANADTSGENFEILIGFDLTPEQLAFNRAGKRFRIDSGENPS